MGGLPRLSHTRPQKALALAHVHVSAGVCLPVCMWAWGGSRREQGAKQGRNAPPPHPPLGRGARIKTSCRVSSSRAASSPATSGRCVSPHSPGGLSPPEASLQRLASPGKGDDPARTDRWHEVTRSLKKPAFTCRCWRSSRRCVATTARRSRGRCSRTHGACSSKPRVRESKRCAWSSIGTNLQTYNPTHAYGHSVDYARAMPTLCQV